MYEQMACLPFDPETGDIVLKRVHHADGKAIIQTNVLWSVVEHSPTGYNWGFQGSGPADLALNILNLFVPPGTDGKPPVKCQQGKASATAWALHQDFKERFIANIPRAGGRIAGTDIRDFLAVNTITQLALESSWL